MFGSFLSSPNASSTVSENVARAMMASWIGRFMGHPLHSGSYLLGVVFGVVLRDTRYSIKSAKSSFVTVAASPLGMIDVWLTWRSSISSLGTRVIRPSASTSSSVVGVSLLTRPVTTRPDSVATQVSPMREPCLARPSPSASERLHRGSPTTPACNSADATRSH